MPTQEDKISLILQSLVCGWISDVCTGPDGNPKQVRNDAWHMHYTHAH